MKEKQNNERENLLEFHDVFVIQFPQVSDVRFTNVLDFFYGYNLIVQLSAEHSSLRSTAEPFNICHDVIGRERKKGQTSRKRKEKSISDFHLR
jgi:hypothetical protein